MKSAQEWIEALGLLPHPEGGFYKETYRAAHEAGTRAVSTAIYFLLRAQDVSHFHRIDADEMWHFYTGYPLTVHMINMAGEYDTLKLGTNLENNETPQGLVAKNVWFGAALDENASPNAYALVGCTVAPGFEFSTFELARQDQMLADFPAHDAIIKRLT